MARSSFHSNRKKSKSITGQVNAASQLLMFIMAVPAVMSLFIMLFYAARYQASVSRMETIASLKPLVDSEISEQLWSTISGRKTFDECGVYDTITVINSTLDAAVEKASGSGQLELAVARRTMNTLSSYVKGIEQNMLTRVPIAQSEATLEEVRNVASLVVSMLEDYISEEISNAAVTTQRLQSSVFAAAAVEILIVCIAVLLMRRMLRQTTRTIREPIEHLEHFAGLLAGGNLQARIPHTDVSELTTLTDRVNVMADRLESLIEQNRREQENLKKSELRLLQAQINPHFLYNTLDAIIWQAESGRSDEVVHLTSALSDFFRISLSSGADWIPVSQEIKHLAGYLSIQKTRYRDILNYEIDVDEDVASAHMLKLLLQPLAENALYHGIKNKRGGGTITVTGRREGERLRFTVADTGVGMSAEKLASVRAHLADASHPSYVPGNSGFGLSNVHQRIRLYYSQEDGLDIHSGPGGTTVSFCVPLRAREESQRDQSLFG